jgi:hypothetical protein
MKLVERAAGDANKIKKREREREVGGGFKEKGRRVSTCWFTRTNKGRLVSCTLPRFHT